MAAAPPSQFGRYEILRELGRGAMGVVYLARDPLIGRLVALKTFRLAYATDDDELGRLRSRFLREAQSAGILSQHPGIVTIHDVAPGGDGTPAFIAMEYVEGTDLKELMKRQGALDKIAVADIVRGIASALDYAHAKGVVHRDVKPANVILTSDRGIRITDFGIARLDAFDASRSNLTLDGQMLGTPNYMSPEQVEGHEVDHRADVFSLGVIAYELLTGKKPFAGENLTAVTHRIVHGEHSPASSLRTDLSPRVDAVIARCLAKKPVKRWPRAGDFAAALDEALAEEPAARPAAPAPPRSVVPPSAPTPSAPTPSAPPAAAAPVSPQAAASGAAAAAAPAPAPARPGRATALGGPLGARLAADVRAAGGRRLALVTAGALVVGIGLWLVLTMIPARLAPPDRSPVDLGPRAQFVRLMREGHRQLEAGDPAAAALAFRRAERLAPNPASVRALRESAEAAAVAAGGAAALDLGLEDEELAAAFGAGGPEDEEQPPEATVDPGGRPSPAAPAQPAPSRPDLRRSRLLNQQPQESAPPRAPPRTTRAPAAAAPTGDAELVVDLASEVPTGSVVVAADGRRIISRKFEFWEKGGRFSRRRPSAGELTLGPAQLSAGDVRLQVWVAVGDEPAKLTTLSERFPRGGQRRLIVRIASADEVTLRLE